VGGNRLGIVGCGAIGRDVAYAAALGDLPLSLYALCDIVPSKAVELRESAGSSWSAHGTFADSPPFVLALEDLVAECDYILECASSDAVKDVVAAGTAACVETDRPRTAVIMSVGGLAQISNDELRYAEVGGLRIAVPSGAIGGLDAILAMRESGVFCATLTTTKPPKSLGRSDKEAAVVFEGSASEAIKAFPKNINVAMTLFLALGSNVPLTVKIVSDPAVLVNTHQVEVEGGAGKVTITLENEPHPEVPRTSLLAAKSAIATLRKLAAGFVTGT
jgi:aspartate dehydrogenase